VHTMPANNTNQSMLRRAQGGSPTSQAQNQRAQAYTRNSAPNTAYNTPSNNQSSGGSNTMYNPMGLSPAGGQFGNQQTNLGRYRPPQYGEDRGGYAYNLPNAYGSTGLGYMSGFDPSTLSQFNPFLGSMSPQGNFGGGAGHNSFLQMLLSGGNPWMNPQAGPQGMPGQGGDGGRPGMGRGGPQMGGAQPMPEGTNQAGGAWNQRNPFTRGGGFGGMMIPHVQPHQGGPSIVDAGPMTTTPGNQEAPQTGSQPMVARPPSPMSWWGG